MSTSAVTHRLPLGAQKGCRLCRGALLIEQSRIRPDPNRPDRSTDTPTDDELRDSVRQFGILQPITVDFIEVEGVYQIVAGRRRYSAACAVGLATIPCWLKSPKEQKVLRHQVVGRWHRRDIDPYDLANALARLRDSSGCTQRGLARELGKSEGEISKCLTLLELSPAVQKLACEDQTGRITRRHLYAVHALPPEVQLALIQRVREEAIPAIEFERIVANQAAVLAGRKNLRAAANSHRLRTSAATLTLVFHKEDVRTEDILAAIEEARLQVTRAASETKPPPAPNVGRLEGRMDISSKPG